MCYGPIGEVGRGLTDAGKGTAKHPCKVQYNRTRNQCSVGAENNTIHHVSSQSYNLIN